MYDRILVAIDATLSEENESAQTRAEQIGRLTGATVYILHVARGHIVSGDITAGAGLGVQSGDDDVASSDRNAVQALVDRLSAAGIETHGEVVSATSHDVGRAILQRAQELDVDLLVLGHQHHRGAANMFRSSVADWIIHHHPPFSILLARPPGQASARR
jgi:nucleotide-binding universal stress UspA family protein